METLETAAEEMQRGENRNVVKFSDMKSETDLKSEGAKAISISVGKKTPTKNESNRQSIFILKKKKKNPAGSTDALIPKLKTPNTFS